LAIVVVQIAGSGRVEQAAKMVEAVAIMPADGGIEHDGDFASEVFVADFGDQRFTLPQRFDDGPELFAVLVLAVHTF